MTSAVPSAPTPSLVSPSTPRRPRASTTALAPTSLPTGSPDTPSPLVSLPSLTTVRTTRSRRPVPARLPSSSRTMTTTPTLRTLPRVSSLTVLSAPITPRVFTLSLMSLSMLLVLARRLSVAPSTTLTSFTRLPTALVLLRARSRVIRKLQIGGGGGLTTR